MKSRIALRFEAELGDDLDGQSDRLRGRDLVRERAVEFFVADARMALRITGDADGADAAPAQQARVDGVDGAAERSAFAAVAGDDKHVVDPGLAGEPSQHIVERRDAAEIAHREMRHRLAAGRPQPNRGRDGFVHGAVRRRAEIDARAAPEQCQCRDVGVRRPRRFDRKSRHERGNALNRGGKLLSR